MSNPLVATNLSHSFVASGGPQVLAGANVTVAVGEALAVTGVSGCGKSTLLHILGGLAQPDSGEVTVATTNLAKLSPTALGRLRNQKLGFVYQQHHLLNELNATENVALPLLVGGESWESAVAAASEILTTLGLREHQHRIPAQLSGGQRQRVAIARALANQPVCIIADEPTGNLDAKSAAGIIDLLLENCKNFNASLLIATHDQNLAQRLDRRLELVDGKLVAN